MIIYAMAWSDAVPSPTLTTATANTLAAMSRLKQLLGATAPATKPRQRKNPLEIDMNNIPDALKMHGKRARKPTTVFIEGENPSQSVPASSIPTAKTTKKRAREPDTAAVAAPRVTKKRRGGAPTTTAAARSASASANATIGRGGEPAKEEKETKRSAAAKIGWARRKAAVQSGR